MKVSVLSDHNVAWTESTASTASRGSSSQAAFVEPEVNPSDGHQLWWRSGHLLSPLLCVYVLMWLESRGKKAIPWWNNDSYFHVAAWKPTSVFRGPRLHALLTHHDSSWFNVLLIVLVRLFWKSDRSGDSTPTHAVNQRIKWISDDWDLQC